MEATLVSVPFVVGVVGVGGFFEEVSDFGGLTPFTVSIPSTVTVFPGGIFSTFSSFFFPIKGRLEQEVIRNKRAVKKTNRHKRFFLFRIMNAPSSINFGDDMNDILSNF